MSEQQRARDERSAWARPGRASDATRTRSLERVETSNVTAAGSRVSTPLALALDQGSVRPVMDIQGLGWRTDLALLEISGSLLEDRGDHVVVRTPDNPTFWWGNFVMLAGPPADAADARQWLGVFEAEFPGARHRTFGIDGTGGSAADAGAFAALGFETEVSSVMTATSVARAAAARTARRRTGPWSPTPTGSSRSS